MLHARHSPLALGLGLLIALSHAATAASAPDAALEALQDRSRTGVLYDRVLPLARLDRLDGGADAPVVTLAHWRQAYDELRRASIAAPVQPDLSVLDATTRASLRSGVIPLAIIDRAFERFDPGAPQSAPLVVSRAFAATALAPRTLRGANLAFALEPDRYVTDGVTAPHSIEVDFADGCGFRSIAFGERVRVRYATTGRRTLTARVTRTDGSTAAARFAFDIDGLAAPSPDDTLQVTAAVPHQGQFGSGEAYVYLAPGHVALTNPVVVVEGFDLDNSMSWDELYELLNRESLLETLRADGFDAVVLNFADATVPIQENAFVVAELIQQVQATIAPEATLAVVGASMGGLCSRYALAWLESQAQPHRVRTWISFDAPHGGASIPLGLQYWIDFFSGQSAEAAAFLAVLQRPAARQMLIDHFTTPPSSTPSADPMRPAMLADFATLGDYPTQPRLVSIVNGSGAGQTQGFQPGEQLLDWSYSSPFFAVTGDVWAIPDVTSTTIFNGHMRIFFSTTNRTVTVNGTRPWDGAPGGSRASLAELDSVAAPFGDIVALHPSHCFIPTVSALALDTLDPFFDVDGTPDLLALTPFDAVYVPAVNQEHVLITPENAAWARAEIGQGVVAAPMPEGAAGARLAGSPNPFAASMRVSFRLPHAGDVDLRVFAVDGREVRALVRERRAAGAHVLGWDGRDARNDPVAAGVYFLRLATGAGATTRRVVRVP